MSIRLKQMLLLLSIALLPAMLSAWQSHRQMDAMATEIAATTRQQELNRERHYLREKVADIGTSLRLIGSDTEDLLSRQSELLETVLQGPAPARQYDVLYSNTLAQADLDRPSFLSADPDCAAACEADIQKLAAAGPELLSMYRSAQAFSLWHYAGLENGISVAFPGHGNYPAGYDPRSRPWYQAADSTESVRWLPMTIDASTGQPVLTAAAALRGSSGELLGVTAIDLPLQQLLNFSSSAAPWLNVAQLALLHYSQAGGLRIVAKQRALEPSSDWTSEEQTRPMEGLSAAQLARMKALSLGDSVLFESVDMQGEVYNIAITGMGSAGDSWLALISPHSATEGAVTAAVAVIEQARGESMRHHLYGAAILALIAAAVALYAANRVTAPLIRMSRTAGDLAAGHLDSRTGLKRKDELGLLSTSIDIMADNIEQLQLDQEQAYRDMIMTLHRALEKKDAYTAGHSGRVTQTALKLGRRIGLDEKTLEILRFGALTHDLGKIGITDTILNKPAPLEGREIEIMRQHPTFSKTIMKPMMRFREYAEIAGSHHEHWDGGGYPEGLKGEEIHLLARIVAIADAWDSMVGDRVYRKGMPVSRALEILEREQDDGQFDPSLIREFIAMVREENGSAAASA